MKRTVAEINQKIKDGDVVVMTAEEVISYGVPAFAVDGKAVAGYSAAKNHCSYLPMSGSVLAKMADALAGYQWSKGALRFAVDEPLPADLIGALVDARLAEVSR